MFLVELRWPVHTRCRVLPISERQGAVGVGRELGHVARADPARPRHPLQVLVGRPTGDGAALSNMD